MNDGLTTGLAAAVAGARRAEFERQACKRRRARTGQPCEADSRS